ncbi:hypothetical protein MIND_00795800 [Mycena indigotica]|uniref:F-box domain-containing protein n=1 Tax=Mycena indigotica TaxID=2126181 RepID=A0A8H6SM36_9AGAR|nr:uncharacterized protein MIND_00795800 [Mycena indigotica]KAF7302285.1 hypothetical protein MIND_00795800 [Mycena indigotica]
MELPLGLESLYEQLSQAQQSQISGLLREGLADEAELEHELDAVLSFVRDLQDLLGRRKNNNYVLASFLSPIRRLPVEIMAEIFEQCVRVDSAKLDYFSTNSQVAPLLLLNVCSWWRKICLGSPRLWTNLTFRANEYRDSFDPGNLLARSGQAPLNVTLNPTVSPNYRDREGPPSYVLHTILRSDRFVAGVKTLAIPSGAVPVYAELLQPMQHFTQLTTLALNLCRYQARNMDRGDTLETFSNAPLLTSLDLTLSRSPPPGDTASYAVYFPWGQLTHLGLAFESADWVGSWPMPLLLNILRRCQLVTHLTLGRLIPFPFASTYPVCHLPAVKTLVLNNNSTMILPFLAVPGVQELVADNAHWDPENFASLKANSGLTKLRVLDFCHLDPTSTQSVLRILFTHDSTIEELRLPILNDEALVRSLIWLPNRSNNILPRLTYLWIGLTTREVMSDGGALFLQMVRSRVRLQTETIPRTSDGETRSFLVKVEAHIPAADWSDAVAEAKLELLHCGVLLLPGISINL